MDCVNFLVPGMDRKEKPIERGRPGHKRVGQWLKSHIRTEI